MSETTAPVSAALLRRYAELLVGELVERRPRALGANDAAKRALLFALYDAVEGGFAARRRDRPVALGGAPLPNDEAWELWAQARRARPDGDKPEPPGPEESAAAEAASEAVGAIADDLGIVGLGARRHLRRQGRRAASEGALLVEALTFDPDLGSIHMPDLPPDAEGRSVGLSGPSEPVLVASASNHTEAEEIEHRLHDAGIPTSWRRAGDDLPHLGASGYRDIFVPEPVHERALAVLEGEELPWIDDEEPVERMLVSIERTWLRLLVKVVLVTLVVAIVALALGFVSDTAAVLGGLAALFFAAGVLAWSEVAGTGG